MPSNAGFFVRFFAYIIDSLILFFATLGIRIIGAFSGGYIFSIKLLFNFSFFNIILFLVTSFYFILMTYFTGQTIGKMLLKIKVVNDNYENEGLNIFQIIIRETFAKYLSKFIFFIGFFMIGFDSKKRALHDILCDTRVVYVED